MTTNNELSYNDFKIWKHVDGNYKTSCCLHVFDSGTNPRVPSPLGPKNFFFISYIFHFCNWAHLFQNLRSFSPLISITSSTHLVTTQSKNLKKQNLKKKIINPSLPNIKKQYYFVFFFNNLCWQMIASLCIKNNNFMNFSWFIVY